MYETNIVDLTLHLLNQSVSQLVAFSEVMYIVLQMSEYFGDFIDISCYASVPKFMLL
jgi:hypothetical protein